MTRKWFTAFILIAAITGGALAGVHNDAGKHRCPMESMMGDCCATAAHGQEQQEQDPQVSAARLCCALNCSEPGTTVPTGSFNISSQLSAVLYAGAAPPAGALAQHPAQLLRPDPASQHPPDSHPAYIRHLALLI
jgi:hypothetical protein